MHEYFAEVRAEDPDLEESMFVPPQRPIYSSQSRMVSWGASRSLAGRRNVVSKEKMNPQPY